MTTLDRPLVGSTLPRLWTPPLVTGPPGPCGCGCALTPETSDGFELVAFAEEIDHPLLPFQRWSAIHGLELLPDGRPRFRIVLLLVARQNGKTTLPKVMCAWWQFRKSVPLILGTSTQLTYAKETWQATLKLVQRTPALDHLHEPGRKWYRRTNGETESWSLADARYKIAASNAEGGRSLTIDRGIADELRQHHTYEAWEAFEPACSPEDAQIWCLSNAGSDKSVVLNDLQDAAREFIATGVGDPRLGLQEYSAPEDAEPDDVDSLLMANPRVGYGLDLDVLLAAAARAKQKGGQALTGFKTERMCIRVKVLNPAIDPGRWKDCLDRAPLDLEQRQRLAACVDLS
ncbi:terminase, partial [Micromonospora sp. NPDC050417]|uniref:terminase n=1 Tax=Micromonospora sp. NPDC050417 TaxID=3364280 RepID=UPI00379332FD